MILREWARGKKGTGPGRAAESRTRGVRLSRINVVRRPTSAMTGLSTFEPLDCVLICYAEDPALLHWMGYLFSGDDAPGPCPSEGAVLGDFTRAGRLRVQFG